MSFGINNQLVEDETGVVKFPCCSESFFSPPVFQMRMKGFGSNRSGMGDSEGIIQSLAIKVLLKGKPKIQNAAY